MPIENYGVLKGRITACWQERENPAPHYHVRVRAAGADARVSINVQSHDRRRPDLLHFVDDDFRHPITLRLAELEEGWHPVAPAPGGLAVDYVRGGMVSRERMRAISHDRPGPDNDLNDRLDALIREACDDPEVEVYAFGSAWGPEPAEPDEVFGFEPGRGMHDVHMNQGNARGEYHARQRRLAGRRPLPAPEARAQVGGRVPGLPVAVVAHGRGGISDAMPIVSRSAGPVSPRLFTLFMGTIFLTWRDIHLTAYALRGIVHGEMGGRGD